MRMEEDKTERILNLTLEIIYLLTGEDYEVVKKISGELLTPKSHLHCKNESSMRPPETCTSPFHSQDCIHEDSSIPKHQGEDVNIIKANIKDEQEETYVKDNEPCEEEEGIPLQSSTDGSSYKIPPERCAGPLYSWDCTQGGHTIPHHCQNEELTDMKIEVIELETDVGDEQHSMELLEKMVTSELRLMTAGCKGTPSGHVQNPLKGCLTSPPGYDTEDNGITQYSLGGNLITGNTHHRLHHERSPDPFNPEEPLPKPQTISLDFVPQSHSVGGSPELFFEEALARLHPVILNIHPSGHCADRAEDLHNLEGASPSTSHTVRQGEEKEVTSPELSGCLRNNSQSASHLRQCRGGTHTQGSEVTQTSCCVIGEVAGSGPNMSLEEGGELMHVNAVVKVEEEETNLRSDQQSAEEDDIKRTIKEEEETYVRDGHQSMEEGDILKKIKEEEEQYVRDGHQFMEEGDILRTIKEEEEEMYVRSDQLSMEEGDMMKIIKEEEETYVRSDQRSAEEGDILRTIKKEEEETYVKSDQRSAEEGDILRTFKKEEEETYVRSDQRSVEEGDILRIIKEEEEMYVKGEEQSMEEGGMLRIIKVEDIVTEGRTAQSPGIRYLSETHLSVSTDCTMDDVIGQESPADILVTPNIPPDFPHLSNSERPPTQQTFPPAGGSYSCPTCGKCFTWKSSIVRHERTHTGEKPYACTVCGKCFGKKSILVLHERTHTGEKPYTCSECGNSFGLKAHLVRHVRAHTGEKPYPCAECGKCFGRKSHLVRHERSHMREMFCTKITPYRA
ncbi:uncharacterized protein [Hyperolius riggenbachi]|uniref:uncharacterized protein isoform X2 n=1 Tax=Hyperolius riggenbachi TaxID=752182 RepID=UPI0035A2BF6D